MIIGVTVSEERQYPNDLDVLKQSSQILHIKPGMLSETINKCDVLYLWNLAYEELEQYLATNNKLPNNIFISQQGVDDRMLKLLQGRDVNLGYAKNVFSEAISEYALASILMLAKNLQKLPTQKAWIKHEQLLLKDIYVLLLGRGSISTEIKRKLDLLSINNTQVGSTGIAEISNGSKPFSVAESPRSINMIVSCLPLNDKTDSILNDNFFKLFKHAGFINISRGRVVKDEHLISALDNKNISAALLDAFTEEPLPKSSEFWADDRIVISPHQSYRSTEWSSKLHSSFINYIRSIKLTN